MIFFWYEVIKEYYNLGLYNDKDLDLFVEGNMITEEEKMQMICDVKIIN